MSVVPIPKTTNYILAVDDIPDNLFLIKLALEQEGYNVVLVGDGSMALEQIEKSPPDLVLLDVMMPKMDGYEVTRRIRANSNLPYIPILLITAHEQSSVVQGLDSGADEFIRKPFQIDELQARVRSLLRLKYSIDQRENFVRCLTHDLRTPLVAADRMLHLILQGVFGEASPELKKALENIISNNQNLLEMLNTLLEVHHYEVGEKTLSFINFNLAELIEEVVAQLTPLAEAKGLELRMNLAVDAREIRGDRLELRRVLTNLIGNAIKFTDTGFVEVRSNLSSQADGKTSDWVAIEVRDTGIGIAPDDRQTIFERFRQGAHKRFGHGLGLHLCQQIVQGHHGTIEVQSELDRGSIFTVRLPLNF
ncbi:MAG: hybrid sensor histidine kinase/response regulator [Hydrococcus sp. C42_A2020_068]|nr:hybrid sensor histidine kinase/response regulator [Hydrococcus sp. C42_A2020_068]